ncbi:PLP-dependent aminotransferase family protein [Haloimpatiens lingqiaonensis]|uniref:aminotransferase-like domain-containing protein n=1 Tax=Haloimpatiens lingqiaonensis TaxID=1380675 RepID=UPI0010FED7A6|nr:PLP-dependent aminotransferase family protein [Haloimpatiens lingqiaonensis]
MEIKFSDRANGLKASEIRELLKLTQRPEVISFAGGLPAPELFPIEQLKEVTTKVLDEQGAQSLQYSTTEGYLPLREIIVNERMAKNGVKTTVDNILVVSGSQQALEFSAKLFVNKGDVIICESPSYLGALNAFKAYEPEFVEIPMDDDGMEVDKLEEALKNNNNVKMIYTIPDFQNPSGKTMSIERRKRIAELAAEYKVPVIEDSPYGELIFEGKPYPCIKSFDKAGYVVTLGTFSKTFCPGLRLGWICAEEEILKKYVMIKQGADLQSNTFTQMIAARFMQEHNLDEHINKIIEVYRKRRDLMLESMEKYFPKEVTFTYPKGGLFTWVNLKEGIDAAEVNKEALKQNVAFVPGGSFYPNGGNKNHFRLNYSNMSEEKIVEGIKRLGEVLKKFY